MRTLLLIAALGLALPPPTTTEVTLDQSRVSTTVGARLRVTSHIANTGSTPTDPLVAHLNVASLDGVYTDLEDWSADVTRAVDPIAPGSRESLLWEFQAVNTGEFDVYVAVMPNGLASAGRGPLVVSPPLHITVGERRPLNAAGALPVVLLVPLLVGSAATAVWLRRRGRVRAGPRSS